MDVIKIVGIGGSLAPVSHSLMALQTALDGAGQTGAAVELFDIRKLNLPLFVPGIPSIPKAAESFAEAAHACQGMIWSSPMYHGSVSGAFKNTIDWLELLKHHEPAYLTNKIIGLISTAGGVQGLQAINTMEFIVRSLRAWAVPLVIPIPQGPTAFEPDGNASDPKVKNQLQMLGQEVYRAAAQFHNEGSCIYSRQGESIIN